METTIQITVVPLSSMSIELQIAAYRRLTKEPTYIFS